VLSQRASCSSSLERDVHQFGGGFPVLEAFGDHAERKRLDTGNRFVAVRAIAHNAGKTRYLGNPASVVLALKFDRESHLANVPSGLPSCLTRGCTRRSKVMVAAPRVSRGR
jgi:hypothetical protein